MPIIQEGKIICCLSMGQILKGIKFNCTQINQKLCKILKSANLQRVYYVSVAARISRD